jgi:peptidyl-prolyl cis-trans isomerase-like protein 2
VIEEYRDNEQKNKETPKPEKTKEELKAEERLKERQKTFRSTDSAAFTSSVYEPAKPKLDEYIPKKTKKKGFVSLVTNKGTINLMLHCDLVPRTCENFLTLCERGYYNNTKFHRSIRNFMVQGGDPTGTGRGGESIWGKKFRDEFHPKLRHEGRGVLSMANSGKNTNGSQLYSE